MGASSASAAQRPVPFSYLVSGTASPTSSSTFTLAGSGVSIPLGKVSYTGNVTITGVSSTGVITDILNETLTAADGDTVTITCHQVADPTKTPGVYLGMDNWTVTSGTGQFSDATGAGVGTTSINLNNDTFDKAEAGTVT